MTPQPLVVITPDISVIQAERLLLECNQAQLPVVESVPQPNTPRADKLVGLITRSTMLQAVPWSATSLSALETQYILARVKVSKVMLRNVVTVTEDVAVEEAARIMVERGIGCLPVLRDGLLVGLINDTTLLATMSQMVGSGQPGLRLSVTVPHEVGAMARLSGAIAAIGGNLTAFSSWEGAGGPDRLGVVLKVDRVSKEQLLAVVAAQPGVQLLDVRQAQ
jgi:acetoin utilization protein AcuB